MMPCTLRPRAWTQSPLSTLACHSGLGPRRVVLLADRLRARLVADNGVGARFTLLLPASPVAPA